MKTKNYWINRSNERMDGYLIASEKAVEEIETAFRRAETQINVEIESVYRNLVKISDAVTAKRYLDRVPDASVLKVLKNQINNMPAGAEKQRALTELSSPAYKARIDRLQATIDNSRKYCNELYKTQIKATDSFLSKTAKAAYYKSLFDITMGTGYAQSFSLFPKSRIDQILKQKWNGTHYSKRIWNNTDNLAAELKETLLSGFMSGQSNTKMADAIAKKFDVSVYAARRLIRTETNYVANNAELHSYSECGIEQYEYVATLDGKTSKICQELDGQIFNVEDGQSSVNMPPMHPHCRSTTIAHFEGKTPKERFARDKDGKPIRVRGDMTYKEWMNEVNENNSKE